MGAPRGTRAGWAELLALAVCAGWLAYRAVAGSDPPVSVALADLKTARTLLDLGRRLAFHATTMALLHVPLGFLAALALGSFEGPAASRPKVGLVATLASLGLAFGLAALRRGELAGPLDLLTAGVGCLLGVWCGLTWTRGWVARLLLLPKLAALVLTAAVAASAFAWMALESAPAPFAAAPVTSDEKRQLYRRLREANPIRLPPGQTATVRLTAHDVDVLLAWGLSLGEGGRKARLLLEPEGATLEASARVPRTGRFLNLSLSGLARIDDGRIEARPHRLRVGRIEVPRLLLRPLVFLGVQAVAADPRARHVLQAVRRLDADGSSVTLTLSRLEPGRGLAARMFHGDRRDEEEHEAFRAHVAHLLDVEPPLPPGGDRRFADALRSAFAFARGRSGEGRAVLENRAALLALGLLFGTDRLERLTGPVLDPDRDAALHRGTTLRGRSDWSRHFVVSAALTVLSIDTASDAAGLLKEELDADGGSGFSFTDLLADRAGTSFAAFATRDEEAARRAQERLERGFRVEDYFPSADGLPEGIADAELTQRYGGVGGMEYRRLTAEIERRLVNCPALRD